ncbi:hypothetical protein ABID43_005119 [Methylobacterium goesingense]|uniref:Uncharacterized protein n=1 Tax=Methylobacterium goesingense TaxID=243690 RepID=A0ABV2LFN5_9HYPH
MLGTDRVIALEFAGAVENIRLLELAAISLCFIATQLRCWHKFDLGRKFILVS